ncbi:MAG: penicillin-binding protein 2 [Candidatus Zixiibacteriota bacterium]|nr:MAG: penicillin-binding protein 2 [candidate division Zixibacteria bacterium]
MSKLQLTSGQREKTALAVIAAIVIFLVGGLVKLQIINHQQLAAQSENNHIRVVPITPRRGVVYDRENRRIIDSRPSYTISVVPAEQVKGVTLKNVAQLLKLDTLEIRRRIRKNLVNRYQPAPVKRDAFFETIAVLEEQSFRFPGVTYQIEQVRRYPVGLGSETFTGYVGEVSRADLKRQQNPELRLGSMIGKKGIEKQYDTQLRGHEGTAYIEVTASGQILGSYEDRPEIPAVSGADLVLSIDLDLQQACSDALDTFCCGAIVAADPKTGEILAMASYPSYDANIFSSVIPESVWQDISSSETHPLLNRPLKGLYPPGSTVKFVTVGAALEEGLITPSSTLQPCLGGFKFGNRVFHCWKSNGHGRLIAVHALERSCDIYMYQLGLKMGVDLLSRYYGLCGFGQPTGIDLPGEEGGLNPNSTYYDERYGPNKWTRALVLNNSIGQGEVLVTLLQLVQFYCGLVNEGIVYRPSLVRKILWADGNETTILPEISFRLPFSPSTLEVLCEGMRLVVEGEHGTARSLRSNQYSIGGKTGTAQNPHGEDHSWFVGVAPFDAPEIVVCALVENAGHGSDVAAPVVGQIIESFMQRRIRVNDITMKSTGDND